MRTISSNSTRPRVIGPSGVISGLFVYGSLGPNAENAHYLAKLSGRWQKAYADGRLYPNGLPGTEGYPALDLTDTSTQAKGLLFTSRQLISRWQVLDDFEGPAYRRQIIKVRLSNGRHQLAYTYGYCGAESAG
ncbi:MAG TPA: gamma-glutamylcyclotransferase family protein [Marinagarivorans sp.]